MDNLLEQIERIKIKLEIAKKVDKKLKVFGASSHKYKIGNTISEEKIKLFEKKYNIQLPASYTSFLTKIGNGGISYEKSAVGPFYGIYPLGKNINELVDYPNIYLSEKVKIHPNMSDEFWSDLIKKLEDDSDMTDDEYDKEMGNLFAGILPIGSQGCTYLHGLILNGKFRGRVVNLDLSRQKPKFTFENNFLDWYERWLDEVITGRLLNDTPSWFGYQHSENPRIELDELKKFRQKKWYEIWKT
ncbi:SMI1/KNR4 family protein [Tenacibaculum sp. MEBiC06402]|uniref:SMI1/KNR4 family protein n=1 Tax=unclassified Tenacibaculum TaxID=2635139 RepID=UPI003B9C9114